MRGAETTDLHFCLLLPFEVNSGTGYNPRIPESPVWVYYYKVPSNSHYFYR